MPARRSASRPRTSATRRTAWARIRLFAMDVDGVLTDGTVTISSDGHEAKAFSILDGHGIKLLMKAGVEVAWISGRASGATTARARELGVRHVVQGRVDKITALRELAGVLGCAAADCAYMGDDVIDAPAMVWAGIGIAPPHAMPAALAAADYVTAWPAGRGAVREVCERLLASRAETAPRRRPRTRS